MWYNYLFSLLFFVYNYTLFVYYQYEYVALHKCMEIKNKDIFMRAADIFVALTSSWHQAYKRIETQFLCELLSHHY